MRLDALYHFSPANRRDAIRRDGLIPGSTPVTATEAQPHLCFATDPAVAWVLSGGIDWNDHIADWDLWMIRVADTDQLTIVGDTGPYLRDIWIPHPIPARRLWLAGTRTRTPRTPASSPFVNGDDE